MSRLKIENLIEFETADKPIVFKSSFPYEKVLASLKVLDSTKSLIFKEGIPYYRIVQLRRYAKNSNLGFIKVCKKEDATYMWLNKSEDSDE